MKHQRIISFLIVLMICVVVVLFFLLATPVKAIDIEPIPPEIRCTEPITQTMHNGIWREDVPLSAELQLELLAICGETDVDPLLALGLIETESGFQADIVSPWGDYGLCQLNRLYFPADLTPEENMAAGIGLLAYNIERYGDIAAALTAYNRGHDDGSRSYAFAVLQKAAGWGYEK